MKSQSCQILIYKGANPYLLQKIIEIYQNKFIDAQFQKYGKIEYSIKEIAEALSNNRRYLLFDIYSQKHLYIRLVHKHYFEESYPNVYYRDLKSFRDGLNEYLKLCLT